MGLDMYLSGKKVFGSHHASPRKEDGMHVEHIQLALGYWRKHQMLHDYIVEHYAYDSKDDCNPIELTLEQVSEIIDAVQYDKFPADEQWSDAEVAEQKKEDIAIFGKALLWVSMDMDSQGAKPYWKSIIYQASW